MQTALGIAVAVLALLAVAAILVLAARRARTGGVAGSAIAGAVAAYDEAMHSTAHDRFVEVQQQKDRTTPIPAPDDRS